MEGFDFSQLAQVLGLFLPMAREALAWLGAVHWGVRILLLLWLLWIFYLAVMNLQRVHKLGKLGRVALTLGVPALVAGYLLDVLANLVVFSVLLLERPRWGEWTVTARLQRHHGGTDWRSRIAQWFETELLGAFDHEGSHVAPRKNA